ncbi:MAG: hypothetical protein EOO46_15700 [Flavobacterium sp.]|nr:MAG: hypothetical protein EOO46_15700 [Flavobacterium sp.]
MKKTVVILILFTFVLNACKSKSKLAEKPKVEIIEPSTVDKSKKDKAYSLGKRVLMTCNTSKFKPFNKSEATESVIKNTTLERLTSTCHKFRIKYGKFEDIKLAQVIHNLEDDSYIFRYKAEYQRKFTTKELRVTLNNENKVSAIKSTDWTDELK